MQGVANRDIKLENTLLDGSPRPLVKLCDFGFSKDQNMQSMPHSRVGTPAYLPPEVINAGEGVHYSGPQADVWSLGVLLYVMVTGDYPFNQPGDEKLRKGEKLRTLLQRIQSVEYSFPAHVPLSDRVKDLIKKILVADPAARVTVADIAKHPWFTDGLSANVLDFNDRLVEHSGPVSDDTLTEIETLVYEASYRAGEVPQRGAARLGESAMIEEELMNVSSANN